MIRICRELTKKFEEVLEMTIEGALEYFEVTEPKGEMVLIIEGLNHEDMRARFGADIPRAMLERAASPVMAPYCICDDSGIRLTRRGMLISNAIICELMEHL